LRSGGERLYKLGNSTRSGNSVMVARERHKT